MKKRLIWVVLAACVMLVLPWAAVTLVKGPDGMAVCFFLFFFVNPVFSVLSGIFSGTGDKALWALPCLSALFYLVGVWIFFDLAEPFFIFYAAVYLILGLAAMLLTARIRKKHAKNARQAD